MRLEGVVYKRDSILGLETVTLEAEGLAFSKALDTALLSLCKALQVPIPIWLKKNSREFLRFRQTVFTPEQFAEEVSFDNFQIKLID